MKPSVEVQQLWKTYALHNSRGYQSLRENLSKGKFPFWAKKDHSDDDSGKVFHALRQLEFQFEAGSRWGIMGRNGAGKSTLLKILAGITPPSQGLAVLRGTVGALLEVGTGFHPELTGRENIFFNGAILGMKTTEIRNSMDEIIDFSGVEALIDQPLKTFSTGMHMRLAFSVAAHLRTDILLIDEVLAVGDAAFQRRCLGKMEQLGREEGKTVVVVSHDLTQLSQLCTQAILLEKGRLLFSGPADECIAEYRSLLYSSDVQGQTWREGNGSVRVKQVDVCRMDGSPDVRVWDDLQIKVVFEAKNESILKNCRLDIGINNASGRRVAWLSTVAAGQAFDLATGEIIFKIRHCPLKPGQYDLNVYTEVDFQLADWLKNVYPFTISYKDYFNDGERTPAGQGDVLLSYEVLQA